MRRKAHLSNSVDNIDRQILSILQKDGRLSLRKVAEKAGVSVATTCTRVKILEDKGVVNGYTAIINPAKMGFSVTAVIFVQSEDGHIADIESVAANEGAAAIYNLTGEFQIAIIARFKGLDDLSSYVNRLSNQPYVRRTLTNVALNIVKEDFRIDLEERGLANE